jgi:hypothetical protein
VEGQPQDMEHNCGREGGNGGGNQAAAAGHECACPPPPPACAVLQSLPSLGNGSTKIFGQRVCVRRLMAGNSSRCSLPPPLAMSCNPSPPWANGHQRSSMDNTSAAASSQRNKSQGSRDHNSLVSSNNDPDDRASGFQGKIHCSPLPLMAAMQYCEGAWDRWEREGEGGGLEWMWIYDKQISCVM